MQARWPQKSVPRPLAQLDVLQQRIALDGDLVLDRQAASRAAELAELRQGVDEALRVAGDRVAGLDGEVVPHAPVFIVVLQGSQVGGALCTTPPAALDRQVLGGADLHLALNLLARRRLDDARQAALLA